MPAASPVTGATSPSVIQSPLTVFAPGACAAASGARARQAKARAAMRIMMPYRRLAVERSISSVVVMTLEFIS